MKGWYRDPVDCAPPPARFTLERITVEQVDLYQYVPPLGENIPVFVEPFPVEDLVPTEEEINCEVKQLRNNRSGGPSGMMAEHVKGWRAEARKKEK